MPFPAAAGEVRTALDFGADSTGLLDSTREMQAFVDWVCDGKAGRRGVLTPGTYLITRRLTIPPGASHFELVAEGRVTLLQACDDTPILYFADENATAFRLPGCRYAWVRDQPATHRHAIAIAFDTAPGSRGMLGYYNFALEGAVFVNGYRGIATWPNAEGRIVTWWGAQLRRLIGGHRMSGAIVCNANPSGEGGSPNIEIDFLYHRRDRCTEPSVILRQCASVRIGNVELNNGAGRAMLFETCTNVHLGTIRSELGALRETDGDLLAFADCTAVIDDLELQSIAVEAPERAYVLRADRADLYLGQFTARHMRYPAGRLGLFDPGAGAGRLTLGPLARRFGPGELYPALTAEQARRLGYPGTETLQFFGDVPAAGAAPVRLARDGGGSREYLMARPGWVIGVHAWTSQPLRNAALELRPAVASRGHLREVPGLGLRLAGGNSASTMVGAYKAPGIPPGGHRFEAGDLLSLHAALTGRAGGAALRAAVLVTYD